MQMLRRLMYAVLPKRVPTFKVDRELMNRYVIKTIDPKGVIIDVGAGTGSNALELVRAVGLDPARCHLIEPDPMNFEILKKNCPDFVTVQAAIAPEVGEVTLYSINDPKWEGSSKSNTIYRDVLVDKFGSETIIPNRVRAMTTDSYFEEAGLDRVEFVTFNCEGAEYELFDNHLDWLDRTRLIWIDLHGRSRKLLKRHSAARTKIYDLFIEKGFTRVGGNRREDTLTSKNHLSFLFERLDWPSTATVGKQ